MNPRIEHETQALMKLKKHAAAGTIAWFLLLPLAAWSGGVVTNCTEANLRVAMSGGGTVTFACDGVIMMQEWTHPILVEADTILDGSAHQITISGNVEGLFHISTNITFSLVNLTIANSQSPYGPCIRNSGGFVNLTSVGFYTNSGLCIENSGGCVNLMGVGFYTNTASPVMASSSQKGGAIVNRGGTVNATNCTFAGNRAQMPATGGAPAWPAYGGGLFNENGEVNLSQCLFLGNLAAGGGGAGGTGPPFGNNPFPGAEGAGGAVANLSGTVTIDLCAFHSNTAVGGQGGSGYLINRPSPSGAAGAAGWGGAVFNLGTLVVRQTSFADNGVAGGTGGGGGQDNPGRNGGGGGSVGGGALFSLGEARIDSCAFAGNTLTGGAGGAGGSAGPGGRGGAGGAGGSASGSALFNGGSGSVTNCTFAANSSSGAAGGVGGMGGGIYSPGGGAGGSGGNGRAAICESNGSLRLVNCTVAANGNLGGVGGIGGAGNGGPTGANGANGAALGGGLLASGAALLNSLIATNTPGGNCSGFLTDLGHNLSSDGTCNFTNVGSLNSTDPKLGPLADNGGPTLTMALLPGSPAIDAGDTATAPPTDQREHLRPVGLAADIGAYEYGTTPRLRIALPQVGTVEVLLYDASGQVCRLLTSTNLSDWQCIATNQIGANGTALFQENCAVGEAQRFYRVAVP